MDRDRCLARVLARICGRSLPIRGTTSPNTVHPSPVGIAPMRRSGDERVQALAYGRLGKPPVVLTLLDPLAPDHPGLDRLGEFLQVHLRHPHGAQVWVPDRPSLAALAIEGQRSYRNPHVSPARQQLGICLQALARLEPLPGQQVVAVATDVLAAHLITGQSPVEDEHLAGRLAWDDPQPGSSPAQVAAIRREHPGPSLLTVAEEDRVERLRARLRAGRGSRQDQEEIAATLTRAVLASWDWLVQAWQVFTSLPLPPLPGLEELETASSRELERLLGGSPGFAQHLGRACVELQRREAWRARLEDLEARGDPIIREGMRQEGRVIAGTLLWVRPPWFILATAQPTLRLRAGTRLTTADTRIETVVDTIQSHPGRTLLLARLTRGTRALATMAPGQTVDWFDTVAFRGKPAGRCLTQLPDLPPAHPLSPLSVPDDLLGLSRRLHQP